MKSLIGHGPMLKFEHAKILYKHAFINVEEKKNGKITY